MPRTIKFRAYHPIVGMSEKIEVTFAHGIRLVPSDIDQGRNDLGDSDWILMQFTGLTDKNGTEIYEGDIVKSERAGGTCFGIIEWFDYTYRVAYKIRHDPGLPEKREEYLCSGYIESDHQVIGNIYCNPSLLERAKEV